jgi:hypothetical protein
MGSQPNQTSAADSYPLDGSIDNLWTRIILSEILLTFFCWDSVSFLERWKRSSLSSTCFAYYLYMLWLSVTVDWCFQFCDSVVVLFFSAVCASLTQFCDEWGLIFWLPFSPSFHEWDVRPRWKFVRLGSHYLLPESTWMTATCSRWSKFSHTFLFHFVCVWSFWLGLVGIVSKCCQWPPRVSFACLVVCLDAIDVSTGQSLRSSFSWYCLPRV